jgi:hypothetical protein
MQTSQTTIQYPDIELHFRLIFSQPYRLEFRGGEAASVVLSMSAIPGDDASSSVDLGTMPPVTLSQAFSLDTNAAFANSSGYRPGTSQESVHPSTSVYRPDTSQIGAPSLCKKHPNSSVYRPGTSQESVHPSSSGYRPGTSQIGAPSLYKN